MQEGGRVHKEKGPYEKGTLYGNDNWLAPDTENKLSLGFLPRLTGIFGYIAALFMLRWPH